MTAQINGQIINGQAIAQALKQNISQQVQMRINSGKRAPSLAVIILGDNQASKIYVAHKRKTCQELNMVSKDYNLPETTTENELVQLITNLNNDNNIDGILIQLPLPNHINNSKILETIRPDKDVDGFHPYNIGKLSTGFPIFHPCTPKGVMTLLQSTKINLTSKYAVIVGASNIVGKPMAMELINANCTVTTCHNLTLNLAEITRQADILISATGVPKLITVDFVKPGAVVIDVGITRLSDGKIVGDVDFAQVKEIASWITPVPGGVGPMTVATLMENTLYANMLHV